MPANVKLESDARSKRVWLLSLILPYYRNVRATRQVPEPLRIALRQVVLSADEKLCFVRNAKAGGKSVMRLMHRHSGAASNYDDDHRTNPALINGQANFKRCLDALGGGATTIFGNVVHPEKRAVAAFAEFFLNRSHFWRLRHMGRIRRLGYSADNSVAVNFDIFLDYVGMSFQSSELYADRHWRKQVHNLGYGAVKFDHIVHVESLQTDMEQVLDSAGIPYGQLLHALDLSHSTTPDTRNAYAPTPAQRRRIEALYADDFEAFGY